MIDFSKIEDMGNAVKINDTIIPAVNIQVDGFPAEIDGVYYNVFFEILFEFGSSWTVSVFEEPDMISVDVCRVLCENGNPVYIEIEPASFVTNSLETFVAAYIAEVSWQTMAHAEKMTERFKAA